MKRIPKIMTVLILTSLVWILAACGSGGNGQGDSLGEKYGEIFSSFSARDLSGETKDEQMVLESEYTLVYLWSTTCGPCIDGMPKMQAVYDAYRDKGVNVIGIVLDITDQNGDRIGSKVADALEITSESGVTFTNIDLPAAVKEMIYNEIQYTPTAFFVDNKGRIHGELYIGVVGFDEWSELIDGLLEEK